MAILKADLATKLTTKQSAEVKRIEAVIDARLKDEYVGIPLMIPAGCADVHHRVKAELTILYTDAGWKIGFEHDQREGEFIRIE